MLLEQKGEVDGGFEGFYWTTSPLDYIYFILHSGCLTILVNNTNR